jgi:hypothetical protein
MKVDIIQLLIIFDELIPSLTNEEQGLYWFRTTRKDNLIVTFSFSIYENYAGVLISNKSDVGITNVNMKNCTQIRILDQNKKCFEIIHESEKGRCFVSLLGESILEYSE